MFFGQHYLPAAVQVTATAREQKRLLISSILIVNRAQTFLSVDVWTESCSLARPPSSFANWMALSQSAVAI
jgi:hypothetical protein